MEDFPKQIADLLESAAAKVRALTVDKVARVVKWVALAPVLLLLVFMGAIFLGVGLFRLLAEVIGGDRIAYAAIGGLFLLGGLLLWSRRTADAEEDE